MIWDVVISVLLAVWAFGVGWFAIASYNTWERTPHIGLSKQITADILLVLIWPLILIIGYWDLAKPKKG